MVLVGEAGTTGGTAVAADAPAESRSAGASPPRLRHVPALDGLRGIAVAVVVVFHLERLRGGFLGVDLFFVLSGYLITSLLLAEYGGRDRIDLGRFWSRRARRLLPALFLLMVGVVALLALATDAGQRPLFRWEALATLGYVANWQAMGDDVGYWDMFTQPSPLDHMWSLAIEEQFYLVWPLLAVGLLALARRIGRGGARVVFVAAALGAAVSFAVLAGVYSPLDTSRAYFGTDARVGPTLLGAALAGLTVAGGRGRRRAATAAASDGVVPADGPGRADGLGGADGADEVGRPPGDGATVAHGPVSPGWVIAGLVAAAVMTWSVLFVDGTRSWYYQGGLLAFSLAAVTVVHLVTSGRGGILGRALSVWPLTALGVISYGVYLWHWPVMVYLTPQDLGISRWLRDLLCVAVTLAAAVLSYVLIERPIRRGALRGRPVRVALVASVAALTVGVVVVTNGVAFLPGTDLALGSAGGNGTVTFPEEIPAAATRILLVGDSGVIYLGPALADEAERHGAVAAADARPFCTILVPQGVGRNERGQVNEREPCHDQRRHEWSELVEGYDPDVVVYYIAAGGGTGDFLVDGEWIEPCDDAYEDYLRDALIEDVDVLAARGAPVLLTTTPEAPFVAAAPDAVRRALDCRRETQHAVVAARPGTHVIDMAGHILEAQSGVEESFYVDPVHLSDVGAADVARWLVPQAEGVSR
jgi:peptidoglycan/LPS O-acetylase OafA/YrhL